MISRVVLLLFYLLLSGCMQTMEKKEANQESLPEYSGDLIKLRMKADKAYQNKRYTEAVKLYRMLIAKDTKDAIVWFRLGNIYARTKQPKKAVEAYEKSVYMDSSLSKAWHNMGIVQLQQSANSFTQMAEIVTPRDPLYKKAQKMSRGTVALLTEKQKSEKKVASK